MKLPLTLKKDLRNYSIISKSVSRLGGKIFQFRNISGNAVFLKTGRGVAADSLTREKMVLDFLQDKKITVPNVLNYVKDGQDGITYLLISGLDGLAAQKTSSLNKKDVLNIVAKALKQFHSISIKGGENLRTLDKDLDYIQTCVQFNLIKRRNFQKANQGKTPEDVYLYLCKMKNIFSNNNLVHGDYCLPNIMVTKKSYGFIDLGDCGPGDPYKDFSAMEVSIARNFGKEWIETFYQCYGGLKKVDELKIKYYQLIDQFGYHLDVDKYLKLPR